MMSFSTPICKGCIYTSISIHECIDVFLMDFNFNIWNRCQLPFKNETEPICCLIRGLI